MGTNKAILKNFIQNLQNCKTLKNKICRNYKIYCVLLVTGFSFSADLRQALAPTGPQCVGGLSCQKLS